MTTFDAASIKKFHQNRDIYVSVFQDVPELSVIPGKLESFVLVGQRA